jgi:CRISPR-associated protein Csa1
MFFLTEEERQFLIRGLLPRAHEEVVNSELRGWNWNVPPLAPPYELKLPLYQVAGRYCDSGRDLYLYHALKVRPTPTPQMVEGRVLHEVVRRVFTRAKRLIYTLGVERIGELAQHLADFDLSGLADPEPGADLLAKAGLLWRFEAYRIIYRVEEILTKQPYIKEDSLAFQALPVILEQRLDGRFLGLSQHLSTDAMVFSEPMIIEVKFGPPMPFYRLYTTGYALVVEALYGYPVNLGCLVYPRFLHDGRIAVERDLHLITDELRSWFVERRDELTRLVVDDIDPGLPARCYEQCQYWRECHPADPDRVAPLVSAAARSAKALNRLRSQRAPHIEDPGTASQSDGPREGGA